MDSNQLDKKCLITLGMLRGQLEGLSGRRISLSSRDNRAFVALDEETGAETRWIMPPSALALSMNDMSERYLCAVASEIQRNWRG